MLCSVDWDWDNLCSSTASLSSHDNFSVDRTLQHDEFFTIELVKTQNNNVMQGILAFWQAGMGIFSTNSTGFFKN